MFSHRDNHRISPAARRRRCRLTLEPLEDRLVLSTAAGTPAITQPAAGLAAGMTLTAYANQPLAVVANFNTPANTTLLSTINWDDVHMSAGTIAPAGNQTVVSGVNAFAQAGTYSVVIAVVTKSATPASAPLQVAATVVVRASSPSVCTPAATNNLSFSVFPAFQAADGTSIGFTITSYGSSTAVVFSAGSTGNNLPATPAQNAPPVVNVPVPAPAPAPAPQPASYTTPPVQMQIRVATTDYITWSSTREQGLNTPTAAASLPATAPPANAVSVTTLWLEQNQASVTQVVMPGPASVVITIALRDAHVAAFLTAAPEENPDPPESPSPASVMASTAVYQQPLYRVAERSQLSLHAGATSAVPAASPLLYGSSTIPPVQILERDRRQAEELEGISANFMRARGPEFSAADASLSLVETIAFCALFQALHAPEARSASAPAGAGHQPGISMRFFPR